VWVSWFLLFTSKLFKVREKLLLISTAIYVIFAAAGILSSCGREKLKLSLWDLANGKQLN
jgi:hypothetical protein